MASRRGYDLMYRLGAPWDGGPRAELVDLVTTGAIPPGEAVDLGCGRGHNAVFLAGHGFDVTGIDFSPIALSTARSRAAAAGVRVRFVEADLTGPDLGAAERTYDLVVDDSVLDDLRGARRQAMAATMHRVCRAGGHLVLWCCYDEIAWWRRPGARCPGLHPDQIPALFGRGFTIDRLPQPAAGTGFACFLLTRRAERRARPVADGTAERPRCDDQEVTDAP